MTYKLVLKDEVVIDISKLTKTQKILVYKQFKKLQSSPELGKLLGNRVGFDLSGFRKIYVDKKKIRIVYKIIKDEVVVEVVAVGKREDMKVYKKAFERK